jgi:acetolactate synthase-1/2/3 large subunit
VPRIKGAEYLARALEEYGVTHVFFVPTILSATLYELEASTRVARVLTHGEKAAAYMADGYARVTGRPGVCMAQMVGAANLAAGLRDARLACSPVVAITGGPSSSTRDRNAYQENDDIRMMRAVTKFSTRVDDVARLPDSLRQAFRSATTGKPGPVHIELAGHFGEEIEDDELDVELFAEERYSRVPAFRPLPELELLAQAARTLEAAQRPVIVAGGGVRLSGAGAELLALAEALAIPVATALNAKDTLPGDHPLNLGVPGLYSRKSANRAVLEADLVFFVGSQTGSQVTFDWQVPPPGTPVMQLDLDPTELGRNYPNRVSLLGDARATLAELLRVADTSTATVRAEWVTRARELVAEWRAEMAEPMTVDVEPIRPERICGILTEVLPDDAVLVSDTGHSGIWTGSLVDLKAGQGYIRCAGSLGWGLPGALGAQLAAGRRPVVLFTGDGGLYYHVAELETAVRWRVPVVIVVNDNRSLNQEINEYAAAYGGQLHGRHHELWQFDDVDLARLSESLGAVGVRVTRPDDLASAITAALGNDGPTIIDVATDMTAVAPGAFVYETAGSRA